MALANAIVWEFRSTGAATNGGGFKTGASGTDYSQQDAAQLSLTDLAMTTATTTLTSATGGFTAAMIGNVIQIASGTNFTPGFYEITAHTDTNTVTLDRDATNGTNASSGVGAVGGSLSVFSDQLSSDVVAGNIFYFKTGTFTQTETVTSFTSSFQSSSNKPKFIGYNTTRGDEPVGANRPTIACGAFEIDFNSQANVYIDSIIFTGTSSRILTIYDYCIVTNCRFNNTAGGGNGCLRIANVENIPGGFFAGCEFAIDHVSAGTNVLFSTASYGTSDAWTFTGCLFTGGQYGIRETGSGSVVGLFIDNCVFRNPEGFYCIDGTGLQQIFVRNSVFYGDPNSADGWGIYETTPQGGCVENCIFYYLEYGIYGGSTYAEGWIMRNNAFYGNTNDVFQLNHTSFGGTNLTSDPEFTDPDNDDYTCGNEAYIGTVPTYIGGIAAMTGGVNYGLTKAAAAAGGAPSMNICM